MPLRRFILATVLLSGCGHAPPPDVGPTYVEFAAVVDGHFRGVDGAALGQSHEYRTIAAALASLPDAASSERIILIRKGRYHEKLSVDKPHVTLMGEGRDSTIITYNASADTPDSAGGTYGTRGSFTLRVTAPDFHAAHLRIDNAFHFVATRAAVDSDPARMRNTQAVALHLERGSDRAEFEDCQITGWQDTLYANAGRAYFHDCVITGQVDFIFGAGIAVFDDDEIVSRAAGFITAPSTPPFQRYGFVFLRSRITRAGDVADNSVALGRPWHPSSNPNTNPSAVYIDCLMDAHITFEGWAPMSGFSPDSARFYEYASRGPGAYRDAKRRVLGEGQVVEYTIPRIFGDWRPVQ